ncbi:MAG: LicD family protein [Firmicutes bacterium ADurb.BinA205]|nr:MAG: LicD family protein [Firmicutes bacterium ADurb.BinA205]
MEYELRDLQTVLLYISKEIKRVCESNGIKYTMIGGTLIGAVRHKGFIPWDDDMDFVMTRDNYDKFVKCCKTQLGSEFELQDWKTDPHFGFGFCKILMKNTEVVEKGKENMQCKKNAFVDVIPFDRLPANKLSQYKQDYLIRLYRNLVLFKSDKNIIEAFPPKMRMKRKATALLFIFMSRKTAIRKLEDQLRLYNNNKKADYTSMLGSYGYQKEITSRKLFDEYVQLPFEDTEFMAIKNYDVYLSQVFGDYMQLPPEEKRVNHGMSKVDFGDFFIKHIKFKEDK